MSFENNKEYASKGLANGLGIPAVVMSGVALANQLGNGNGLLGGLFGGGTNGMALAANAEINAQKDAKIAKLEAEKYTDIKDAELRNSLLVNWLKPLSQESASNIARVSVLEAQFQAEKEKSELREQLMKAEMEKRDIALNGKIDRVADHATCGISRLGDSVAGLRAALDKITAVHIPTSVICPEVMPRWNAWEAPTAVAPATQPVTGTINSI